MDASRPPLASDEGHGQAAGVDSFVRLFEARSDPLAETLRTARPLGPDRARARERWFAALSVPEKASRLFDFEMLLKGIGCLQERANHPGDTTTPPPLGWDWRVELRIGLDALRSALDAAKALLGARDRMLSFRRYVASLALGEAERARSLQRSLLPQTPEEALLSLRAALGDLLELGETLAEGGPLGARAAQAWFASVLREVSRSPYFDPLLPIEFRPEFDRLEDPRLVELLSNIPSEAAQRAAVLSVLTIRRLRRYLDRAGALAATGPVPPRAYAWLAVFRSDVRSLFRQLTGSLPDTVADALERELMRLPAERVWTEYDRLLRSVRSIPPLVGAMQGLARTLEAEAHRAFSLQIPPFDAEAHHEPDAWREPLATLQAALAEAFAVLLGELGAPEIAAHAALGAVSERESAERLRREIWMFQQVLRAFLAKAEACRGERDGWESLAELRFVKDFAIHFRTLGYQLLRAEDYPALDGFLAALEAVRSTDVLEPDRLAEMARQAEAAQDFLETLFDAVGQRETLRGVPFDRRVAAESLRFHLERGRIEEGPDALSPLPPAQPSEPLGAEEARTNPNRRN